MRHLDSVKKEGLSCLDRWSTPAICSHTRSVIKKISLGDIKISPSGYIKISPSGFEAIIYQLPLQITRHEVASYGITCR